MKHRDYCGLSDESWIRVSVMKRKLRWEVLIICAKGRPDPGPKNWLRDLNS